MKRRLSRCLVIGLLAAITLFFPLLASPHRIDEAHRNLIREGMTAAEVESIFGVPPGRYDWAVPDETYLYRYKLYLALLSLADRQFESETDQPPGAPVRTVVDVPKRRALIDRTESWTSRHGSVMIGFDAAGRVGWISGWHQARIEPLWKKWWEKIRGR
jgi:hypothetical protein